MRASPELAATAVAALLTALAASSAAAQCRARECVRLTASDRGPSERFGRVIAARGDVVAVGCPEDDALAENAGAVYLYRRTGAGWVEETKLTAEADAGAYEEFGGSLALWDDFLVVGTRVIEGDGPYLSGAAYVYRHDGATWQRETTLVGSDAGSGDGFAFRLAARDGLIVAGAPQHSHSGVLRAGSAYVFRFDGEQWVEEQRLDAPQPEHGDRFGYAVAAGDDAIVVGSRFDDVGDLVECGSASVFRHDGDQWRHEALLLASDAGDGHRLGSAVAISGNEVLVGAPLSGGGAAYFFCLTPTGWQQTQRLAAESWGGDSFGAAVALHGDLALVGAPDRDPDDPPPGEDGPFNVGAAYAFRFDGDAWTEIGRLNASDPGHGDRLGTAVALRGNVALVGSDAADGFAGAVYAFRGLLSDCNGNGVRDLCDVADRTSRDCDWSGLPDECQPAPECVCPADVGADRMVDVADLTELLAAWGTDDMFADVNADGIVDVDDLVAVIVAWGPCPEDAG